MMTMICKYGKDPPKINFHCNCDDDGEDDHLDEDSGD